MGGMPGEALTASNIGNTVTNVYKRGKRRNYRKRTLNLITATSYLTESFGFQLAFHCPKNLAGFFCLLHLQLGENLPGPAWSSLKGSAPS